MSDHTTMQRRDYICALTVLSPLHIGSGWSRDDLLPEIVEDDEKRKVPVAGIVRDVYANPFLPGSTLKGALRAAAQAQALDAAAVSEMFGEISKSGGGGRIGALLIRGARQKEMGDASGLPYADRGVFVLSRTAIDPGRGIAARNKLFHMEAVAPGAVFELRIRLETRGDIEKLQAHLVAILSAFKEGRSIGADAASGFGRIRITGVLNCTSWNETQSGALEAEKKPYPLPLTEPASAQPTILKLICDGPFLTLDPAWTDDERKKAQSSDSSHPPHLRALRHGENSPVPFVTGQAVSGALRARLEWLLACEALQQNAKLPSRSDGIRTGSEAKTLSPADRIFGVSGFKGVLGVTVTGSSRRSACETTSVRIDRFTGGPIDNALFSTDSDLGVCLTISLVLDGRAGEDERDLLKQLLKDVKENGLRLGHGTSRGFGWFKAEGVENAD